MIARTRTTLAIPALLLLLSIGFYWKLTLTRDYVWFDQPDMAYIELPRVGFQARAMHAGRFPLWDPHIWEGQPLIGQTQPGPLCPLNLALCLAPLRDGYVRFESLNWHYALVRFLAALFCYLLCRDLGLGRGGSLLAGCGFAFAGFMGSVAWLDVANGALTTPLVFLFLLRAVRGERPAANAALCGLVMGLGWLSGHHEIPILVSLAVAATWGWHWVERPAWRRLGLAALSFALAGLVGAAQLWPTLEFGRRSVRWVGLQYPVGWSQPVPYTIPAVYSLPPSGLLGAVLPVETRYADSSLFLGVTVLALAALGLLAAWERKTVRWLGALAAASLVYAMGAFTPLHGILYALVPGLEKARVPVRAIHLATFALPVLAGFGVEALFSHAAQPWARAVRRAVAVFGALVLASAVVYALIAKGAPEERILLGGFIALALAAVLAAAERGRLTARAGAALLLTLALGEMYPVATWRFPHRLDQNRNQYANALRENQDVAGFLRTQPQPLRVVVEEKDVPTNFGDWHGIDTMQGYVAGVTENLTRLGMHTPRAQSLLGITHRVARKPERPEEVDLFEGASGVHVYRMPNPMPRAWVVHRAESVPGAEELRQKINDAGFDFSRSAAMLGPAPALEACDGREGVEWRGRSTDRLTLAVHMNCRGLLVIADTYYPGWHATVDGRPAPVIETYGALRGVVVPGGPHKVEMRYRPASVLGGAGLTLLGLLAAAVVCRFSKAG